MRSLTAWLAIIVGVTVNTWADESPSVRRARVQLGSAKGIVTSGVALTRVYVGGTGTHEERSSLVALVDGQKVEFADIARVTFTPAKTPVPGQPGEHAVMVEVVTLDRVRLRGWLDRADAQTVALSGDGLKVHLTTSEWIGKSILVDFEAAPAAGLGVRQTNGAFW